MADPVWVDGVTPLNAVNMAKLQTRDERASVNGYASLGADGKVPAAQLPAAVDITGKVDKDSVVVAATRIVASKLLAGDAQPAVQILGDGKLQWGPGGAGGIDTDLFRASNGVLGTSVHFQALASITAYQGTTNQVQLGNPAAGISFGNAADTSLYREGANVLRADQHLVASQQIHSYRNTAGTVILTANAGVPYIYFGSALDTNLYRPFAGALRTNGGFLVDTSLTVAFGGTGGLYFGTAQDTTLYRAAAGVLVSDGEIRGNPLNVKTDGQKVYFGPSYDTNLYRAAAGILKTDGRFYSTDVMYASLGTNQLGIGTFGPSGQAGIGFGSAGDTNLFRGATGLLQSQGGIWMSPSAATYTYYSSLYADSQPRWRMYYTGTQEWGAGGSSLPDTNLYRVSAGLLRTDGGIAAGSTGNPAAYTTGASMSSTGAHLGVTAAGGGTAFYASVNASGSYNWLVTGGGTMYWGGGDTQLYRSAANQLYTPGSLRVQSLIHANAQQTNQIAFGTVNGNAGIEFGISADTNLYRAGADLLATDDAFLIQRGTSGGTALVCNVAGDTYGRVLLSAGGTINFGPGGATAPDTNLYRAGAGTLQTDSLLQIAKDTGVSQATGLWMIVSGIGWRQVKVAGATSMAGGRGLYVDN